MRNESMKKIWSFLMLVLLCAGIAPLFGAQLVMHASQDKDAGGTGMDGSRIESRSLKPLSAVPGIIGGASLLEQNEIVYPHGLLDINNGAVSFWIKPMDWGEKECQFLPIFALDEKGGGSWRLLLYFSRAGSNHGVLDYRMRMNDGREVIAQLDGKVKPGEWNHIVLSWTNMEMAIWLNGDSKAGQSYGLPKERAERPEEKAWFMPRHFWNRDWNSTSALDDIRFFQSDLSESEVKALYVMGHRHEVEIAPMQATVPQLSASVEVDGKLGAAEWADASRLPIQTVLTSRQFYGDDNAWAYLKRDGKYLYIAFEVEKKCQIKRSDKAIYLGDEAEFIVQVAPGRCRTYFIAPSGEKLVMEQGEKQSSAWRSAASTPDGMKWYAELAIPLSELPLRDNRLLANLGLRREGEMDLDPEFDGWLAWNGLNAGSFADNLGSLIWSDRKTGFMSLGNPAGHNVTFQAAAGEVLEVTDLATGKKLSFRSGESGEIPWNGPAWLAVKGEGFSWESGIQVREIIQLNTECDSDRRIVDFQITLSPSERKAAAALAAGQIRCRAQILNADGGEIASREQVLSQSRESISVPFEALPEGRVTLKLTVNIPGMNSIAVVRTMGVPDLSFLGNKLGIDAMIPQPWSRPLRRGDTMQTAFHSFTFNGDSIFPVRAASRETEVISSGKFILERSGRAISLRPRNTVEREVAVGIQSEGELAAVDGSLALKWQRTLEYDGLIRYELTLLPGRTGSTVIDKMAVSFVIPAEVSPAAGTPAFSNDWIDRKCVEDVSTIHVFGKTGVCLFTDDNTNYVFPAGRKPFRLERLPDGSALLTATLVGRKTTVSKAAEFSLALMATPGKPPRPDWRKVHGEGWLEYEGQNLAVRGWSHENHITGFFRHHLLTTPNNPDGIRSELKKYADRGIRCIPYVANNLLPTNNPVSDYFAKAWERRVNGRLTLIEASVDKMDGEKYHFGYPVCPNHPGYRDYLAYYIAQNMDRFGFCGVYFDAGGVFPTSKRFNLRPRPQVLDTERMPDLNNVFGLREIYRRLWKIIHSRHHDGVLYAHNWRDYHPAAFSFVDLTNPGEEYMHAFPADQSAYITDKTLSRPEVWRYAYNSETHGLAMQYLSLIGFTSQIKDFYNRGLRNTSRERRDFSRSMITQCMLNDIPMSGAGYPGIEGLWPELDAMDMQSASFHHFAQQSEAALESEGGKAVVSYYSWDDSAKRFIIVGNLSTEKCRVRLQLPADWPRKATEPWPDKRALNMDEWIEIPALDCRLILLEP